MFSLPKSTPSTMPRAMGKKSVSDSCLLSLPSRRATPLMPSFSPTTISLSPNFSARSGEGERSIPLRRTRVTVQPKFFIRLRSPSCLFIISFLVSSRDSISCMSTSGSSPSSRWPTRTASWFKASSLPTACMQSPSCRMVWAVGMAICSLCLWREMTAPVMARALICIRLRPKTAGLVTRNRQVVSSGNWLRRSFSNRRASLSRSMRMIRGSSLTKRITPITPKG